MKKEDYLLLMKALAIMTSLVAVIMMFTSLFVDMNRLPIIILSASSLILCTILYKEEQSGLFNIYVWAFIVLTQLFIYFIEIKTEQIKKENERLELELKTVIKENKDKTIIV